MEMPKASFETWVRDTRVLSYEDGLFTIGVYNDYARDWLESRLSSTVTRLLMGIMNRGV
jgi:chromosomal replication initiator protein